jgi:hypothetical protein
MQPNREEDPGTGSEGSERSRGRRGLGSETRLLCIEHRGGRHNTHARQRARRRVDALDGSSPSAAGGASITRAAINLGQPKTAVPQHHQT